MFTCRYCIFLSRDFFVCTCFVFLDKEDVTEAPAQQQVKDNTVRNSPKTGRNFYLQHQTMTFSDPMIPAMIFRDLFNNLAVKFKNFRV